MIAKKSLAFALPLILLPVVAHAYIGPGLGAGAVAAVLGVIGAIFLALFAIIWYPIKRMRKNRRAKAEAVAKNASEE